MKYTARNSPFLKALKAKTTPRIYRGALDCYNRHHGTTIAEQVANAYVKHFTPCQPGDKPAVCCAPFFPGSLRPQLTASRLSERKFSQAYRFVYSLTKITHYITRL